MGSCAWKLAVVCHSGVMRECRKLVNVNLKGVGGTSCKAEGITWIPSMVASLQPV